MKGHDDAAADKKQFSKMLKKAMPGKKVEKHLAHDIKDSKMSIKEDKHLIKTMKKGKRGC